MKKQRRKGEFLLCLALIVAAIVLAFAVAGFLGYYLDPYPLTRLREWFHV